MAAMTTTRNKEISFNASMVQAILDGRKTVTRRPVKVPSDLPPTARLEFRPKSKLWGWWVNLGSGFDLLHGDAFSCPYGKPGDRLSTHNQLQYPKKTFIIVSAGLERLQDISEADALKEGVDPGCGHCGKPALPDGCGCANPDPMPRDAFIETWNDIYASQPEKQWNANPWAWRIEFR